MSYTVKIVGNYTTASAGVLRGLLQNTLLRLAQTRSEVVVIVPTATDDGLQALVVRTVQPLQRISALQSDDAEADLLLKLKADPKSIKSESARDAFNNHYEKACEGMTAREEFELVFRVPSNSDLPRPFKAATPPTGNYNDVDRGEPPFVVKTQKTIDRNKIPPKDRAAENFNLGGGRSKVDTIF